MRVDVLGIRIMNYAVLGIKVISRIIIFYFFSAKATITIS